MNKKTMNQTGDDERVYCWEDMYIQAGRITHYMPNQGNEWSFDPKFKYDCFGMFGHLRPFGMAPRGVNLWEMDWRRLCGALTEQFGKAAPNHFEQWWTRSNVDRVGGYDRFMRPGPGMPTMRELQHGMKRPCIVEQNIKLADGARDEYLEWFGRKVKPAAARVGWQAILWMGSLHSSFVVTMLAAPDWSRVLDLAEAMPQPDPGWQADIQTVSMSAWAGSGFLQR